MLPFTFIHAADLHLGCPFQGLRAENPQVAAAADAATYRAFDRILDLAVDSGAAFVLFSGDVYDTEDRNLTAQLRFRDGLRRLDAAGIRACVIHGNHDHLGGGQAALDWPDNVRFFPARPSAPEIMHLDGEPVAAVHGYSYPRRSVTESLLSHFRARSQDEGLFRIGMLHGNVGGDASHDNYAPCTLAELAELSFDYWAMGHVHGHAVLSRRSPGVVYPGTPQGLSPRETGARGCCRVAVGPDRFPHIEFVQTHALLWESLQLPIAGVETEEALFGELERRLDEARAAAETSVIARVTLTGRGPLHRTLQNPANVDTILQQLRQRVDGEPFAWLDRLYVETRPELDLEQQRERLDLAGDFLRLCREAQSDPALQAEVLEALGSFYGRTEVRRDLPLPAERLSVLLERAETLGADLLLGEGAE